VIWIYKRIGIFLFFISFFSCFSYDKKNSNAFLLSIKEKNYVEMEAYLRNGILNHVTDEIENPLAVATQGEDEKAVILLINYGANVNFIFHDISLLQWAIRKKNINLAELLVLKGADINYKDDDGNTVFSDACSYLPDENLSFFLANGVNQMERVKSGIIDPNTGKDGQISYFEYLLVRKKLKAAASLLDNDDVLIEVLHDEKMILKMLYYWTADSTQLADLLITKDYKINDELPLLQEAILLPDAFEWLLDHGVSLTKEIKDYYSVSNEQYTPLEYAKMILLRLYNPKKIDDSADDLNEDDILAIKKVIEILETRSAN
jgi:ankyrin repeat protein